MFLLRPQRGKWSYSPTELGSIHSSWTLPWPKFSQRSRSIWCLCVRGIIKTARLGRKLQCPSVGLSVLHAPATSSTAIRSLNLARINKTCRPIAFLLGHVSGHNIWASARNCLRFLQKQQQKKNMLGSIPLRRGQIKIVLPPRRWHAKVGDEIFMTIWNHSCENGTGFSPSSAFWWMLVVTNVQMEGPHCKACGPTSILRCLHMQGLEKRLKRLCTLGIFFFFWFYSRSPRVTDKPNLEAKI